MVAGVLGVEDVLVHYKCRAPGLGCVAHSDLPYGPVLAEYVVPGQEI